MNQPEYDDDYPTCAETFSTLRIFADEVSAAEITDALGVAPTESFLKGEPHSKGLFRKAHGWFYSTKKLSSSKDTRRHIDLILESLDGKGNAIKALHQRGCKLDIMSYWVSYGQGGPALGLIKCSNSENLGFKFGGIFTPQRKMKRNFHD